MALSPASFGGSHEVSSSSRFVVSQGSSGNTQLVSSQDIADNKERIARARAALQEFHTAADTWSSLQSSSRKDDAGHSVESRFVETARSWAYPIVADAAHGTRPFNENSAQVTSLKEVGQSVGGIVGFSASGIGGNTSRAATTTASYSVARIVEAAGGGCGIGGFTVGGTVNKSLQGLSAAESYKDSRLEWAKVAASENTLRALGLGLQLQRQQWPSALQICFLAWSFATREATWSAYSRDAEAQSLRVTLAARDCVALAVKEAHTLRQQLNGSLEKRSGNMMRLGDMVQSHGHVNAITMVFSVFKGWASLAQARLLKELRDKRVVVVATSQIGFLLALLDLGQRNATMNIFHLLWLSFTGWLSLGRIGLLNSLTARVTAPLSFDRMWNLIAIARRVATANAVGPIHYLAFMRWVALLHNPLKLREGRRAGAEWIVSRFEADSDFALRRAFILRWRQRAKSQVSLRTLGSIGWSEYEGLLLRNQTWIWRQNAGAQIKLRRAKAAIWSMEFIGYRQQGRGLLRRYVHLWSIIVGGRIVKQLDTSIDVDHTPPCNQPPNRVVSNDVPDPTVELPPPYPVDLPPTDRRRSRSAVLRMLFLGLRREQRAVSSAAFARWHWSTQVGEYDVQVRLARNSELWRLRFELAVIILRRRNILGMQFLRWAWHAQINSSQQQYDLMEAQLVGKLEQFRELIARFLSDELPQLRRMDRESWLLALCFRAWSEKARRRMSLVKSLNKQEKDRAGRLLSMFFTFWRDRAQKRSTLGKVLKLQYKERVISLLRMFFKLWTDKARQWRIPQKVANMQFKASKVLLLKVCVLGWSEESQAMAAQKRLDVESAWAAVLEEQREDEARVLKSHYLRISGLRLMRRSFLLWIHDTEIEQEISKQIEIKCEKLRNSLLEKRALRLWSDAVELFKFERVLSLQMQEARDLITQELRAEHDQRFAQEKLLLDTQIQQEKRLLEEERIESRERFEAEKLRIEANMKEAIAKEEAEHVARERELRDKLAFDRFEYQAMHTARRIREAVIRNQFRKCFIDWAELVRGRVQEQYLERQRIENERWELEEQARFEVEQSAIRATEEAKVALAQTRFIMWSREDGSNISEIIAAFFRENVRFDRLADPKKLPIIFQGWAKVARILGESSKLMRTISKMARRLGRKSLYPAGSRALEIWRNDGEEVVAADELLVPYGFDGLGSRRGSLDGFEAAASPPSPKHTATPWPQASATQPEAPPRLDIERLELQAQLAVSAVKEANAAIQENQRLQSEISRLRWDLEVHQRQAEGAVRHAGAVAAKASLMLFKSRERRKRKQLFSHWILVKAESVVMRHASQLSASASEMLCRQRGRARRRCCFSIWAARRSSAEGLLPKGSAAVTPAAGVKTVSSDAARGDTSVVVRTVGGAAAGSASGGGAVVGPVGDSSGSPSNRTVGRVGQPVNVGGEAPVTTGTTGGPSNRNAVSAVVVGDGSGERGAPSRRAGISTLANKTNGMSGVPVASDGRGGQPSTAAVITTRRSADRRSTTELQADSLEIPADSLELAADVLSANRRQTSSGGATASTAADGVSPSGRRQVGFAATGVAGGGGRRNVALGHVATPTTNAPRRTASGTALGQVGGAVGFRRTTSTAGVGGTGIPTAAGKAGAVVGRRNAAVGSGRTVTTAGVASAIPPPALFGWDSGSDLDTV